MSRSVRVSLARPAAGLMLAALSGTLRIQKRPSSSMPGLKS
jgi:hypothetical protein